MLYVTKLTRVVVSTGLQLPSLIWARPISYSVAPGDCVVFVVVPAGFDALCLLALLFFSLFFFLSFLFAMVSVSVNCLFSPRSPLNYFSAASRAHHCLPEHREVRFARAFLRQVAWPAALWGFRIS